MQVWRGIPIRGPYLFAREFWKLRRPWSSGVVYTTLGKAYIGSAPWHTLPNLRNDRNQVDQMDLYIYFINEFINLHSNGIH
jgi:hypothetical protein